MIIRSLGFLIFLTVLTTRSFGAPVVTTSPATEISAISARLTGTVNVASTGLWLMEFQLGKTNALELTPVSPTERYYIEGAAVGNETQTLQSPLLSLEPVTTYHYRFSVKNVNNPSERIDGQTVTFTTPAIVNDGILASVTPASGTPSVSDSGALLNAVIHSGASPAAVVLRYGTDQNFGSQISVATPQATGTTQSHELAITGLAPLTNYSYQWLVTNSGGTSASEILFYTTAAPPLVVTAAADGIEATSATLKGTVDTRDGPHASIVFEYGKTAGLGKTFAAIPTATTGAGAVSASAALTGLRPATTYHYRIRAIQSMGGTSAYGQTLTFRTPAMGEAPAFHADPIVSELNPSNATVTMPEIFTGTDNTDFLVEYGTDLQYGNIVRATTSLTRFATLENESLKITGLAPGTLYHFRFRADNLVGTAVSVSETFRTPSAPLVTTGPTQTISDVFATVAGDFEIEGGNIRLGVEWGTTAEYGESLLETDPVQQTGTVTRSFDIPTRPVTSYHYRHIAFDGFRYFYGQDRTFTSASPVTPPQITDAKISSIILNPSEAPRPYLSADQAGIEAIFSTGGSPATMVIEYGKSPAFGLEVIAATSDKIFDEDLVSATLPNLDSNTLYYWRGRATNSSGTVHSETYSFTTLNAPVVTTEPVAVFTDTSATFNGTVAPEGWPYDLEIAYGSDLSMTLQAKPITPSVVDGIIDGVPDSSARNVTASINVLLPDTTYFYQVRARPVNTLLPVTYSGQIRSFTTGTAASPPTVPNVLVASGISDTAAKLSLKNLFSGSSESTVVFEYGISTAYGQQIQHPDIVPTANTTSPEILLTGLMAATTYHARVKVTNAQGTTYGADFTFDTLQQGNAPEISGIPQIININYRRVTMDTGPIIAGGALATVIFEYGTTTEYGKSTSVTLSAGSTSSNRSINSPSTLLPNTLYHYRLTLKNAYGSVSSPDAVFVTNTVPVIFSEYPTAITDLSVDINATITTNGNSGYYKLVWGETEEYGNTTPSVYINSPFNPTSELNFRLDDLRPSTTYHYRIEYDNILGEKISFTTAPPSTPPTISSGITLSELSTDTATVNVYQVDAGGANTTVSFEYGLTDAYGQEAFSPTGVSLGSTAYNLSAILPDLEPDTVYHVRAKASSSIGTVYGEDTIISTASQVTTGLASEISAFSAKLHGTVDPKGNSLDMTFRWGTTLDMSNTATAEPQTVSGYGLVAVSSPKIELQPDTTYYYQLQGSALRYGTVRGRVFTLKTPTPPVAPFFPTSVFTVSNLHTEGATINFRSVYGGQAVTKTTFEYGTTTAYGRIFVADAQMPIGSSRAPTCYLSSLTPGTEYHIRLKAESTAGTIYSEDFTFQTKPNYTYTTLPATDVTDLSATLHSVAARNGNYSVPGPYFRYRVKGTAPSYLYVNGTLISQDNTNDTYAYSATVRNLLPDTVYEFWSSTLSGDYPSETLEFRTLPAGTAPAFERDLRSQVISDTKAGLEIGWVNPGSSQMTVTLEYGPTVAYGSEIPLGNGPASVRTYFETLLENLSPTTTYHARARATNAQGTTYSPDFIFTTYGTPVLTLSEALNITDLSALLRGTMNTGGRTLTPTFTVVDVATSQTVNLVNLSPMWNTSATPVAFQIGKILKPNTTYRATLSVSATHLPRIESNQITFTTSPPSDAPTIVGTLRSSSITANSAFIQLVGATGKIVLPGTATTSLSYEYGTTESFGNTIDDTTIFAPGNSSTSPSGAMLNGLLPGTTYHYRAKAMNTHGTVYSETYVFNTPTVLVVDTLPAEQIGAYTAIVRGTTNFDPAIVHRFNYGLTTSYGSTITGSAKPAVDGILSPSGTLSNLAAETTYHYRYQAYRSSDGKFFNGPDMTFTTGVAPPKQITLGAPSITPITFDSAKITIHGTVGSSPAVFFIDYGVTSALENTATVDSSPSLNTSFAIPKTLTSLTPGTRYFFRIRAEDSLGVVTTSVRSFNTKIIFEEDDFTAYDIGYNSAKFAGTVDSEVGSPSVSIEWGLDTSYGNKYNANASGKIYRTSINGILLPETTYHYRVVILESGTNTYGAGKIFTTSPVPGLPTVGENLAAYHITADAATVSANRTTAASAVQFEYGTSPSLGQSTPVVVPATAGELLDQATAHLTGLLPDTIYYYRCAVMTNRDTATTQTGTFRTLPLPELTVRSATPISGGTAVLRAEINPNRNFLRPVFEYGPTPALGSTISADQPFLTGNATVGVSAGLALLAPGTTYHYRITALDERGRKYEGPANSFTTLSLVEDWRLTNYGIEANAGNAADMAAPHGDGTPNLLKYSLGIPPTQRTPDLFRENEVLGKKRLGLCFTRDSQKTDLIYTVEANDSLTGNWETLATSSNGAPTTGTGVINETPATGSETTVDVSDTVDMTSPGQRFIRLKVTRNE